MSSLSGPDSDSFVILGSSPPISSDFSHHPTSINAFNESISMKSIKMRQQPSLNDSRSFQSDNHNQIAQDFLLGKLSAEQLESFTYLDIEKNNETKNIQQQMMYLINTIKNNNIFMRQHYSKIQKYQNDVAILHKEHEEQLKKNDEQLSIERESFNLINQENLNLKKELENIKSEILNKENAQMVNKSLNTLLDDSKTQLNTITKENEKLKKDMEDMKINFKVNLNFVENEKTELQQNISEKLSIIQNMSAEIEKFKKNSPKPTYSSNSISLQDHSAMVSNFERRISELLAQNLEILSMKSKFEDEINCREVILTKLKEEMKVTKTELERKNIQIDLDKSSRLTLESSIEVLNIQLDTFKTDFEMERGARQTLAGEKEQLLTELKLLQRRGQTLTDELSKIQTSPDRTEKKSPEKTTHEPTTTSNPINKFQRTSSSSSSATEQEYQRPCHVCPLCNKTFTTLKNLEYHVDMCLDS